MNEDTHKKIEITIYKGLTPAPSLPIEEGRRLLEEAEAVIAEHMAKANISQQAIYVTLGYIRYNHLYLFSFDENGEPIRTWTGYVRSLAWRMNISKSWIFSRAHAFFIGMAIGFQMEELYEIDPLTLSLMKYFVNVGKHGDITVFNEDKLGIDDTMDDDAKLAKLRKFVNELNVLQTDERVKFVKGDLLHKVKYFFRLTDDFRIVYSSTLDMEEKPLEEAPRNVIEIFKHRIKDKTTQFYDIYPITKKASNVSE